MKLSVIMPIYNEIHTLEEIIARVEKTGLADEIVMVDDGSGDGTRELVEKYQGREGFTVILHQQNQGKGAAVRSGFKAPISSTILANTQSYWNLSRMGSLMLFMGQGFWVLPGEWPCFGTWLPISY